MTDPAPPESATVQQLTPFFQDKPYTPCSRGGYDPEKRLRLLQRLHANPNDIIPYCDELGIRVWEEGGRLRYSAPSGVMTSELIGVLREHKGEIIRLLSNESPIEASAPSVPDFMAERWGPGLTDGEPSIDIPRDWRWTVANWPHARWVAWRHLAAELLPPDPTAEQIHVGDWAAYQAIARNLGESAEPSESAATPEPAAPVLRRRGLVAYR